MLCITYTNLGTVSEISINEWLNNYGPSALSLFGTWNPLFCHGVIIIQNEKTNRGVHFEIHFVEKIYCVMEMKNEQQILTEKICITGGFMHFTPPNAVIKWRRMRWTRCSREKNIKIVKKKKRMGGYGVDSYCSE